MHIFVDERQRHEVSDAADAEGATGAVEQDAHGLFVAVLDFENDLPTASAGRNGIFGQSLVVAGRDGNRGDGLVGAIRLRCEDGGTLGAKSRRKRGILLIGTDENGAVGESQRRSDIDMAVSGVGIRQRTNGRRDKFLIFSRQFIHLAELHIDFNLDIFHFKFIIMNYELKIKNYDYPLTIHTYYLLLITYYLKQIITIHYSLFTIHY